jgi:hypothetical protein
MLTDWLTKYTALVRAHSLAGIARLIPVGGIDVCLL